MRHLIATEETVHAVIAVEEGNVRSLVTLIQEAQDEIGRTFGVLMAAYTKAEVNRAAVAVFSDLARWSKADGWCPLLRGNNTVGRLVRWVKKLRPPIMLMAYVLRHLLSAISSKEAHIEVTVDSFNEDIAVGGTAGAVVAVTVCGTRDFKRSHHVRTTGYE